MTSSRTWLCRIAPALVVTGALLWLFAVPVLAMGTLDVTELELTDAGGTRINASWTNDSNSYTMLRVSRTSYPASPSEGDLAFYGTGDSTTLSGYALDTTTYYVSAFGFDSDNVTYSTSPSEAKIGGDMIFLLILAIIPLGLTVAMFATRNGMLSFPSAMFWAIFGAYEYTQYSTPWVDIQYYLFFAGAVGMTIF